ncbi:MAG TPA: peptidase, partial [Bacteroidia bacterium]|nr:peptidase [Bacteroidia bacterium]
MKSIFKKAFAISVFVSMTAGIIFTGCGGESKTDDAAYVKRVDSFLVAYNNKYRELTIVSNETQWKLLTHIVQGDTMTSYNAQEAGKALAEYQGSAAVINLTQEFLKNTDKLSPIQIEQLHHILYFAGGSPQTVKDIVAKKIKAETDASEQLYGFKYMLNGKEVSTNDIDDILISEKDTVKRLAAWECSKEVGK